MRAGGWHRFDPAARLLTLTIHVQPGAAASAVAGLYGDALRIRIAAPAVDNRANAALVDLLRRLLAVPASSVRLRHGARGRRKIVDIHGADAAVLARLEAIAGAG